MYPRIGFGVRLLAFLLDALILTSFLFTLSILEGNGKLFQLLNAGSGNLNMRFGFDDEATILEALTFYSVALGYTLLEVFNGATFGKMILKARIMNSDGTSPSREILLLRWLIKQSPMIFSFVGAALFVSTAWLSTFGQWGVIARDLYAILAFLPAGPGGLLSGVIILGSCLMLLPNRQAMHDMLARTAVFHTRKREQGFEPMMLDKNTPTPVQSVEIPVHKA